MLYKEFQREDLLEVANLYVEAFNSPPWNDQWTIDSASKRLSQMMNCEGSYGLVCYEDEKILGMILGNHEEFYDCTHFNIKEFCIDINNREKGIGSTLLNEFLDRLKDRGIGEVVLFTSRTDGTEGFYQKRGFKSFNSMVMMGKPLNL